MAKEKEDKVEKEEKKESTTSKKDEGLLAKKLAAQAKIMKKFSPDEDSEGGRVVGNEEKLIEFYPTGLASFDHEVLGIGGVPKGKLIEVYGIESSGKSATAMYISAMVQAQNPTAIVKIYDAEDAWSDSWGKSMGLDLTRTILPDFDTAESMGDQIHADLASEFPPEIIIIDSLAALLPEQLMDKEVSEQGMNDNMARAKYLTQLLTSLVRGFHYPPMPKKTAENQHPKLPADSRYIRLGTTPTCVLCINHAKQAMPRIHDKPGVIKWNTLGGAAMKFFASIRLMVKRVGYGKEGEKIVSQTVQVCADKNKLAPPKRECQLILSFKGGISQMGGLDYLTMAIGKNLAEKSGPGWISSKLLPGGKIQGKDAFNEFVDKNVEVKKLLMEK
jgi:recombination protein RecA